MQPSNDLTTVLRSSLQRRLRRLTWGVLAVLAVAGAGAAYLDAQQAAIPFPVPVYEIEAVSGDHTASLLNLPIGQPGVPQAPIPVDVNGDLLPDITVAVNLVNAEGVLNNPPDTGEVLAPNVEITRLETATLLAQKSPPVRVNVKFRVTDLEGEEPDTIVRFGYDTGEGGSIPQEFKALVGGLNDFFNPIEAIVDTTGGVLGLDPALTDLGVAPVSSSYEGPLTLVAGLESGDTLADIDLEYSPFPDAVRVTFGWDDTGQHLTYAHQRFDEIDLVTDVDFTSGDDTVEFDAAIDRLPRSMAVDLYQDGTRGAIDYQARADERLPDIRADLRLTSPGQPPLNAAVDVEELPRHMHAGWDSAVPSAEFTGSGNGIGAVEARITTFDGEPVVLDEWQPTEQQYLDLQMAPGGTAGDEILAAARLERIRAVTFRQDDDGIDATIDMGDGQLPLEAHADLDLRASDGPRLVTTTAIAPLPDLIEVSVDPAGGGNSDQPFRVTYDASAPVDLDTDVALYEPTAAPDAACGDAGTLCATLDGRHIANRLQARVIEVSDTENRIEVDADADPGAAKPDFFADVTIGQDDGVPLVAHAAVESLARDLRIRTVQGADETLEKFEFHTCDRVYESDPNLDHCVPGTEDEIGVVDFSIANFVERPADFPAPAATAPNRTTVTARGTPDTDVVMFEATGRIEAIEKVQYTNVADVFGIATKIGDDQDLEVDVDLAGIDFEGDDPANGRVDVAAEALISPLPHEITFCFADAGRTLTGPTEPVTAECESTDPFGDGASPADGPMVVAYRANTAFDLDFDADLHLEGVDGTITADDRDLEATLALDNVPAEVTAVVQPASDGAPLRTLVTAPEGANFDVAATAAFTTGGTDCDDPQPDSDGDVAVACLDLAIDDLPTAVSVLADATNTDDTVVAFHACDLDVTGTGDCRPGTTSEIGAVDLGARVLLGEPRGVPHYEPAEDQHLVLLADLPSNDDLELRAQARLEEIRSVRFTQTADGFVAATDLGTGVKPLETHVDADLRNAALTDGLTFVGDVLVDPLPRELTVEHRAPGEDQSTDPMRFTFDSNEIADPGDAVDIDVRVDITEAAAAADAACGDAYTACAEVALDRLPKTIDVTLGETEAPDGDDVVSDTLVAVDATPHPGLAKPDLTVDATLGPNAFGVNAGTPILDGKPLDAHVHLAGLPTVVRATMSDRVADDGAGTPSAQLERVAVHTCELTDVGDNGTCDGGDQLDEVVVRLRNFVKRPGQFPPPDPDTPLYVTLTGRGTDFETETRFTDLSDVAYANYGDTLGVAVAIGDTQDFSATVDVQDFAVDDLALGELQLAPASLDLNAEARILPLPGNASFCLRNGGIEPVPAPRGGFLSPCEDADPFADGAPLTHTPLTVAYRSNTDLDVETSAKLVVSGESGGEPITPRTISGVVDITDIPAAMTTHVLVPEDGPNGPTGPMRVLYDTASDDSEQMSIHFEGLMAVGDAICEDPRPTADSICVQGDVNNLPSRVELFLDPTVQEDNFYVRTPTSDADLEFVNLLFASVKPTTDPEKADVMVIEGDITGIPHEVEGSLHFPEGSDDAPSVRLTADPPLGSITGTFRNFIAPDPAPFGPPDQRAGIEDPTQEFVVFQRGDALKASVKITNLRGGGFETLRDADGDAVPTSVVSVDFGSNETIRAYADLMPDASTRTIGDVTLEDVPAGIEVCFRGLEPAGTAAATRDNFCDKAERTSGAFQFRGESLPDGDDNDFSVHAFVRQMASGGADILSADLSVIGIPPVIQGTFPTDGSGQLDVGGYDLDGTTPNGIDEIRFNLASFDVDTHGYAAPPFEVRTRTGAPFPAPTSPRQYASLVTDGGDVQARGRLGIADGSQPSSRLQRIRSLSTPCPLPENAPPDYPYFPVDDDVSTFKCIRVDLEQTSPQPDPFDLHVEAHDGDNILRLRDAGLTDLPAWLQLTLSETETLETDGSFRRRCGFHAASTDTANREADGTTDCMPPRLRFDQPAESRLFGVVEYGTASDVAALGGIAPREALANLDEAPTAWTGWGADPTGIRAKIGSFGTEDDSRVAARVGLRLPIPQSLTVDQVQTWSGSDRAGKSEYWDASDLRFHYVVRDDDGVPLRRLGELAALLHVDADGTQVLLSQPRFDYDPPDIGSSGDKNNPQNHLGTPATADPSGYTRGIDIPAEVGIDLYTRHHKGNGEQLIQADGILSDEFDVGLRVLGGAGSKIGRAEAQVVDLPGRQSSDGPEDPSFRFRINTLADGASPPTGGAPGDGGGDDGGDECTILLCAKTEVKFKDAFLRIDFDPEDDGTGVRRTDAVVNTRDGKQGVEMQAFGSVAGNDRAEIDAFARIDVDPINVFFHAGIPLLGGADFVLLSDLQAGFSLDEVSQLALRHNLLHMRVRSVNDASSTGTTIGPIFYNIHLMHGSAYALFVKLFGVDFLPPSPPPYALAFLGCGDLNAFGLWGTRINNDTDNFVISLTNDPRLILSGLLGTPLNLIKSIVAPFFCLTDVSDSAIPLMDATHPGDPVGVARAVGHPVPGAPESAAPVTPPAPPDPAEPASLTVAGGNTVALCGSHLFTNLTVNGTLEVATAASSADAVGDGRQNCPAGEEGTLSITATNVDVGGAGTITGAARVSSQTTSATGTSGAGHGGAGGNGSSGTGGAPYGNTGLTVDPDTPFSEAGSRGAGAGAGNGGAVLMINATSVDNDGTITVAGGAGATNDGGPGQCDQFDGDGNLTQNNTGTSGTGAGSGGGLVLIATSIDNGGTITARGGAGGAGRNGGGGGGGGGIAKVISPLYTGAAPDVAGGAGGANLCAGVDDAPAPAGAAGGTGVLVHEQGPQSKAESPERFWYPSTVDVPISAAAQSGATNGFQVALCSVHIPSSAVDGGSSQSLSALFDLPSNAPTVFDPCGNDFGFPGFGPDPKATLDVSVDEVTFDPGGAGNTTLTVSGLTSGYEGFYTVALRPSTAGNDCLDPNDGPAPFVVYDDAADCEVEALPEQVDLVLGIDTQKPTVLIDSPGNDFQSNSSRITLVNDAQDQVDLSGIDRVECSNDGTNWFECLNGSNEWELTSGDGAKSVFVRAFDRAGNDSRDGNGDWAQINGLVDTTAPTGTMALTGGTQLNGWYRNRPTLTFSGFSDAGVGAGGDPWTYRFDGGFDRTCATAPSCTADPADIAGLVVGDHEVTGEVRDALGNQRTLPALSFKIDDEAPQTALRTVPAAPDTDGWFTVRPWVVLSAIDQVGASGVDANEYRVDGSGPWQTYTGPFLLPNGEHTVCFRSRDVAGNVETEQCSETFRVDDAAPAAAITFDGSAGSPAPDGANGWYVTVPDVILSAYSDVHAGPPADGQFRYRVDDTRYLDCNDPCTVDPTLLQTGRHLVHWTAVDRLGNTRVEDSHGIQVDTEPPTTRVVVTPPPPGAGLNAWQLERPWVVLDAIDQDDASGVDSIRYSVDGGATTTYAEPLQLTDGVHELCVFATDRAGNSEKRHCTTVQVDTVDPATTAAAPAPDGGDGWYRSPIAVDITSTDATSGVDPTFDPSLGDLCQPGRAEEDPTAPSGTCLSIDGAPFVPWDGSPLDLGEGVHRLRSYSVDVAGRRSAMVDQTYRIDSNAPVVHVRVVPAEGNDAGWWRREPTLVLRADDGNGTSGVDLIEYRLDGGDWTEYVRPLKLDDGIVDLATRVVDVAGNSRLDPDAGAFPIDIHPPVIRPLDPQPLIWSRLLGPNKIKLRWEVTEDLASEVRIAVIIHDVTTNVVRRLDGGVHSVTPGVPKTGFTYWDGKNQSLTGLVPLGVYYYRVVALDPAGNVAHSIESRPITIKLL